MSEDISSSSGIAKKGAYFEWVCDKCRWGARGYDEKTIVDIRKQHDGLGCKEFISMIELRGKRINDGHGD
jgi:hypothetical protein